MRTCLIYAAVILLGSCSSRKTERNFFTKVIPSVFTGSHQSADSKLFSGDYIGYVESETNGLRVQKELGEFKFTLQYKPLEYVVLSDLKDRSGNAKLFEEKKKEFGGLQYFTLRIASSKSGNLLDKTNDPEGKMLDYFAFRMQNDLLLVDGRDTLSCVLHHFERTYNISPYCDFLIAFEMPGKREKYSQDKVLIFDDQLFNIGKVKLKIRKEDIEQLPTLITSKNESES